MTPQHVYLAGPWWDPNPVIREWNTARIELLAALARHEGLIPVYVHRDLMDAGVDNDADPAARWAGLMAACETVQAIARAGGSIWGLTKDALHYSDGTLIERGAWLIYRPKERAQIWGTSWNGYGPRMRAAGLGSEWAALREVPA